jgi:hypothetical protein
MLALLNPTPVVHSQSKRDNLRVMSLSQYPQQQIPFGLITPPYDMRIPSNDNDTHADPFLYSTHNVYENGTAQMHANAVDQGSNSRYNLRRPHAPSTIHPSNPNNNYARLQHYPYMRVQRGINNSAATTPTPASIVRPSSLVLYVDSPEFNIAEFTAAVHPSHLPYANADGVFPVV